MKSKTNYSAALVALTMSAWIPASAGASALTVSGGASVPMANQASVWGESAGGHSVRQGSAPVRQSLEVIVPQPWNIILGDEVDATTLMSWPTSNDWRYALQLAVNGADLAYDIDESNRRVTVTDPRAQLRIAADRRAEAMREAAVVTAANAEPTVKVVRSVEPAEAVRVEPAAPVASIDLPVVRGQDSKNLAINPKVTMGATATEAARGASLTDISTTPSAAFLPAAEVPARFVLKGGQTLSKQVRDWAEAEGWTLIWELREDWVVPSPSSFSGSLVAALSGVISALTATGADIRADVYEPNRTIVVHSSGSKSLQRVTQ